MVTVRVGEYFFAPSVVTVPRNSNIAFVNEGQIVHSWVVEAAGVGTPGVRPGESFVLTLNRVPAGTYTVYCDQAGHTQAGQRGTLKIV
ncbi:MAG: cupredoxin domain-containing protein [Acidimicrobiales bacterium]